MITILWLIRSFQGILRKGDTNAWQDEWFLACMFTILTALLDTAFFFLIFEVLLK